MMKSDKAVCTNDTMEDLGKALTYEAIFTTLIENKVLAIKRDCEERKRAKRQKRKSFGRILFSKKIFGSSSGVKKLPSPEELDVEVGSQSEDFEKKVISQLAACHIHDETTMSKASNRKYHQETAVNDIEEVSQAAVSLRKVRNAIKMPQHQPHHQGDDSIASNAYNDSLSLSDKNGGDSLVGGVRNVVVEVLTHHHDTRFAYDDDGSVVGQVAPISQTDDVKVGQHFDTTSLGSNSNPIDEHNTSTMADDSLTSIRDSLESLSFPSSRCTVSVSGFGAGAVCPEITVNPSCLESTSLIFDKSRAKRLRILEAKSISAQCSPILPRYVKPTIRTKAPSYASAHTQTHSSSRGGGGVVQQMEKFHYPHHQVSFSRRETEGQAEHLGETAKFFSRQNTSEDSANLTMSTLLNEGDEAVTIHDLGRKSKSTSLLVISNKSSQDNLNKQPLSSHLDSNNRSTVNQILAPNRESYIAYATTSNYFPVITTTTAATGAVSAISTSVVGSASNSGGAATTNGALGSNGAEFASAIVPNVTLPSDTAKLNRMTSTSTGSSVAPTGCCATKSRDKEKRFKPSWPSGQSGSDDEYRKRKRKYKRHHRCSDPVLVYPSPSGLQHCILSMPPNQPIQFHYNEDFVYDMTLQVESDKNDDLQEIVPSSRNRKHRHHKHKKRHRHKKPKILVHDLDTRMVKVIDPDDLPQRARWTIIATAFLLLLMCLMLVGITLRMAPIIDDMVRQENERLLQESLNRARFAKNFTDAASYSATAEQVP